MCLPLDSLSESEELEDESEETDSRFAADFDELFFSGTSSAGGSSCLFSFFKSSDFAGGSVTIVSFTGDVVFGGILSTLLTSVDSPSFLSVFVRSLLDFFSEIN